jgi:uncharacterized protein YbbC (DUF1343 family)
VRPPIDILCGTDHVRRAIEKGESLRRFLPAWKRELAEFQKRRRRYLLYS